MHAYTLYAVARPFGCNVIIASFNKEDGFKLNMIEPSGT
jgi:20S proteasome alpha/beta subunit